MAYWTFSPPNVAVFSSKESVGCSDWIYYVGHDEDNGAWQIHPRSGSASESNAAVVELQTM